MTGQKILNLQAVRGLAVLLVLLCHMTEMEGRYAGGDGLLPHLTHVGASGVDLFFVLSGFIMVIVTRNAHRQPGALLEFWRRRFVRVYPLYWLYSLVILAVWLGWPQWVNSSQRGQVDLLASFLLLPQDFLPLLGQGWTLIHEVYFYLVFGLSLLLPRRWLPGFLAAWALVIALGEWLVAPHFSHVAFVRFWFHPLTFQFQLGMLAALVAPCIGRLAGAWLFLVGCCLLATALALPEFGDTPLEIFFLRGLPPFAMVLGAAALEGGVRLPRALGWVGDISYSLYLGHILVISAVGRSWRVFASPGPWDNVAAAGLMMAIPIGAAFVSYRYIEKPMLQFLRGWHPLRRRAAPAAGDGSVESNEAVTRTR